MIKTVFLYYFWLRNFSISFSKGQFRLVCKFVFVNMKLSQYVKKKKKSKVTFNETRNSRLRYNIGASYHQPLPSSQRTLAIARGPSFLALLKKERK